MKNKIVWLIMLIILLSLELLWIENQDKLKSEWLLSLLKALFIFIIFEFLLTHWPSKHQRKSLVVYEDKRYSIISLVSFICMLSLGTLPLFLGINAIFIRLICPILGYLCFILGFAYINMNEQRVK